jgi:hypothetical protein
VQNEAYDSYGQILAKNMPILLYIIDHIIGTQQMWVARQHLQSMIVNNFGQYTTMDH